MEQKVDRTFLSGESRLEIYKQVLKELRVAYKYNESVKYNTYHTFRTRYICILLRREIESMFFDKTIISSYYPDILVLFPEITYELAKEFNATNEKGDTHTGWWEDIYDFNIGVIYPNLEDRITFMEHIIKITKNGTN